MKFNFVVIAALYFVANLSGFSQASNGSNQLANIHLATPNAASLSKLIDQPVNLHTGIPEISIPIYTINEGSLEFPVSLSYHAR